jgi:mevalonate kinase
MHFTAKAPGKVIIVGEHFVVHGSYALAAAIDRGSTVHATHATCPTITSRQLRLRAELPSRIPRPLQALAETLRATMVYLNETKGISCDIESNLPLAAGLGSSAAGAVALVAAASSALGHTLRPHEIFNLAMVSERMIHGNPSGIDPAVATYGGIMLYKKEIPYRPIVLQTPLDFIIGYTGTDRQTSKMITSFAKTREAYPSTFRALIDSTSTLAEIAATALTNNDLNTLAATLNLNQNALAALGVSSVPVDRLIETALKAGCLGAKLTGGGGGGCIIALSPGKELQAALHKVRDGAADAWVSTIPNEGVKVWREKD